MMHEEAASGLEVKFCRAPKGGEALALAPDGTVSGYASLFGIADQGGDIVQKGAYAGALARLKREGRAVRMLWQHDPAQPIGIWEELREDGRGLFVKGRLLCEVQKGAEAAALVAAGAIDGLSIGYRTLRAEKNAKGQRLLHELELWEVSLVTFPMLPEARVRSKAEDSAEGGLARELAAAFAEARNTLAAIAGR